MTVNLSATVRYVQRWTKVLGTLMYCNELSVSQMKFEKKTLLTFQKVKNALLLRSASPPNAMWKLQVLVFNIVWGVGERLGW